VAAGGAQYPVATASQPLNLRQAPVVDPGNIVGGLPPGTIVQAVGSPAQNGFLEIEAIVDGRDLRGYAASEFLRPV
jgi:hypothetical protein